MSITSAVSRDAGPAIKLFKPVTPRKLGIKCPPSLRNRVQSTCLDDAAHLKTYMRLWVLIEVMLLFHDPWLIPQGGFATFVYPQLAAYAFAFLVPNVWTFVLAEARAASSEPFVIEYERLPGSVGDERWRHEAVESTVRLSDNGRGGRSCRIRAAGAYFWKMCSDDEPGLLPAPGGWLAKIRIFFPLPVRAGLDELPCID